MNLTLEEIITDAQSGSEDSMEKILKQFKPLVLKTVRPFFLFGADTDDLIQEGMIGLFNAIQTFRGYKGYSFQGYAERCIHNSIINAVKKATRKKHAHLNESLPIITFVREGMDKSLPENSLPVSNFSYEDVFIQKQYFIEFQKKILSMLTRLEASVFLLFLEARTYQGIAEELDIDEKTVDNALVRVRRKACEILNTESDDVRDFLTYIRQGGEFSFS